MEDAAKFGVSFFWSLVLSFQPSVIVLTEGWEVFCGMVSSLVAYLSGRLKRQIRWNLGRTIAMSIQLASVPYNHYKKKNYPHIMKCVEQVCTFAVTRGQ